MMCVLILASSLLIGLPNPNEPTSLASPDGQLTAVISGQAESRISIQRTDGAALGQHDFSSADGQKGYVADGAQWTPDSRFLVIRMRSSGGHIPNYALVVYWSRKTRRFYHMPNYTADQIFSVAAPDKVDVSTWPELKPATISLHSVSESDRNQLP
jgi:hypothetical protein